LLRLFSADTWKAKIQRSARNLQAIPQGNQCAGSLIRRISEFLDHDKSAGNSHFMSQQHGS
jgi:hypothetical protein